MAIHTTYLRCLGLAEALKFLWRIGRLDRHYVKLLAAFEARVKELEGVDLEEKHRARLELSKKSVEMCKYASSAGK